MRRTVARRADDESGAVLVEFALVALILLTVLAGTFDLGMGWTAGLRVNEATRTGARIGSGQGEAKNADFSLLSGMRSALDSSGVLDEVERVVIFRSSTKSGQVPEECKTGSGSGACNILTGAQLRNLPSASAGATDSKGCIINSTRRGWCPTDRKSVQLTAEYLGVWVSVRHDYLFPVLGDGLTIERAAVMRLEPKESNP